MKRIANALLWATLAAFLPAISTAEQDRQQTDIPIDPCASLLPSDREGYKKCKDGQVTPITIICYLYSWTGGKLVTRILKKSVGEICPPSGHAEAMAQKAREEAAKWACPNGKQWDELWGCNCPTGTILSNGHCIAPPPNNPLPGPTQPINPPCADNPGCRQH